jgi:YidC/Oxa1 family membrane protein insertase
MSDQARVLLALVLSTAIFIVWNVFFPPPRPKPPEPQATQSPTGTALPPSASPTPGGQASTPGSGSLAPSGGGATSVRAPLFAIAERTLVVENDVYRIELSNRGAVVKSWKLKNYRDSAEKPQTLDVVDGIAAQQVGAWPLSFLLDEKPDQYALNGALFAVSTSESAIKVPGEVTFEWSDGRLAARKTIRFGSDYVVEIEATLTRDGAPVAHAIAWRGGFGDTASWGHAELVRIFHRSGGVVHYLVHSKLGGGEHRDLPMRFDSAAAYAGIEDRYFAAAFLPRGDGLAFWHWKHEAQKEITKGEKKKVPVAEIAAGSTVPGPLSFRLFVGPKDFTVLNALNPPMPEIVDFGWDWLEVFAKPLFAFLKWLNGYTHNYGWAIVLMTIIINMVMFPLKVKSFRSMQKMQRVMPEIQRIKQKYSKYKLTDPRRKEEQQETMALYKREGVSPAGSCLPMLLQMPIWFALYQMLGAAIELRHAPWIWWLRDLASPDPWYILPVLMAVTMYVMQKMTPVTTPDPVQQRMMNIMPIMFGGMFVIVPVSSGLVLYILTSNLIGMGQQWYLLKTHPLKPASKEAQKK